VAGAVTVSVAAKSTLAVGEHRADQMCEQSKLEESMLGMVQDDIPGVIVSWLYMRMLFSFFC
jgi:hypothetical protein